MLGSGGGANCLIDDKLPLLQITTVASQFYTAAEPANGFSTVWTDKGKLRFEPMVAVTDSATENTDGKWQPTWSQLGALRYDGFNMSSTGQYLTFVNRVWPESTSKLTLYGHRKIVRRTVLVGTDNDLEQVLPVLLFRLVNRIGDP